MPDLLQNFLNAGRPHDSLSPWELRRFRYINTVVLISYTIGPLFLMVYALWGLYLSAASILVVLVLSGLAAVLVRRTTRTTLAGNLCTLGVTVTVIFCLIDFGGLRTAAYSWILIIPTLGVLLSGTRWGLLWGGIVAGVSLAFWGFQSGGLVVLPPLPDPLYFHQAMVAGLGSILTLCVLLLAFVTQSQDAERQTRETIAALDTEIQIRRQAEQQARSALEVRSRFLAMMSHEIRTPLNGMLGMGRLLQGTPLSSEQQDLLQTSLGAGETLLAILNDILDFSKLDAGQMTTEQIPLVPARLAQEVIALYRAPAEEKQLRLELELGPHLPSCILGDPTRVRQILGNLISNAVKFTETGHIRVLVQADTTSSPPVLQIEVQDTGIGISAEAQAHLFKAFVQAEGSISRRFGGTGLGLAISHQLIARMGGTLSVQSQPGQGSTFLVRLPYQDTPLPCPHAATLSAPCPAPAGAGRSLRILVAEDNRVNQKLILSLLKREGHEVHLVTDGLEAVQRAGEGWDLLLMDMQMPRMDGLEATRHIRATLGGSLPIVALTANVTDDDRQRCLEVGMNDFLTKPLLLEAVIQTLARWGPLR